MPHDAVREVASAVEAFAATRTVLLCESPMLPCEGEDVVVVPPGTKLSKIRRLAELVEADLFLICDPDFTVSRDGCRAVVRSAFEEALNSKVVIAYGVVEGKDDGTLLSKVIAVDKWLSHHIIRPFLWTAGVGITLPGQFLIVSSSLLRSLDPTVDSYLDDLYLGWVARRRRVRVLRVATVVGEEDSRSSWLSLLTQRVRWMKGIASLSRHLARHPSALVLIGVHYLAYHGIPILWLTLVVLLGCVNLLSGVGVILCLATVISVLSGRPTLACITFLTVFPLVHVVATLVWWMPVTRSGLTRR
ncbi:MAG: glycosyltransferase family 2 protein [Isosphaeraceae bacterium]